MGELVQFPDDRIVALPNQTPSALCQWKVSEDSDPLRLCRQRAFYALEVALPGKPTILCVRHLDAALQQSVAAPGDVVITPLVIERPNWAVGRLAWRLRQTLHAADDTRQSAQAT